VTIAMKNLVESEKWRRAGVNTFYRKSLILATVCQPGISTYDLSKIFGTTPDSINTAIRELGKKNLLRKEKVKEPKRTAIYPTPYAKDLANIIETV
jgi:hypothetical protein